MKKVLIINYWPYWTIGGQEYYNSKLIKLFIESGWNVEYFALWEGKYFPITNKKLNIVNYVGAKYNKKKFSFFTQMILEKKGFNSLVEILKNNKYDLIIDSTQFNYGKVRKQLQKNKNYIWIQHQTKNMLDYSQIFGEKISKIFYWIGKFILGYKASAETSNNNIFFTKYDKEKICKRFNINCNYWLIPLSNKIGFADSSKEKALVYCGRLDNHQKKINYLLKLSKHLNINVHIYGAGKMIDKIKKNKYVKYCGQFNESEKNNIYSKYLFTICCSKWEGFSYMLVESICSGTPIIIPNSFDSAEFLIDKENNGMIYDKKLSAKKLAKKINCFIDNMTKEKYEWYRNNCLNFANNELDEKKFNERWINIIKKY